MERSEAKMVWMCRKRKKDVADRRERKEEDSKEGLCTDRVRLEATPKGRRRGRRRNW